MLIWCSVEDLFKHRECGEWKDDAAEADLQYLMRGIVMIRNARQESGLPAQQKVPVFFVSQKSELRELFAAEEANMMRLAMLESLEIHAPESFTAPRYAAMNADGDMEIMIPLDGLIDLGAEAVRLTKEINKADSERAGLEKRLSSPQFINKAPAEVVEKARKQQLDLENKIERLKKALARFADSN